MRIHQSAKFLIRLISFALLLGLSLAPARSQPAEGQSVLVGNFLRQAPCGIAWIVNNDAAFVLDTGGNSQVGTAAPDDSYHSYKFTLNGANLVFEWGRLGNNAVGRISTDRPTSLRLTLSSGWPGWTASFTGTADGATGVTQSGGGEVKWALKTSPAPTETASSGITVAISPDAPVRLVAGLDALPELSAVDAALKSAAERYAANRPHATGDWGDFVAAIADNLNNARVYSNDNHMLANTVSRGWGKTPNGCPYFGWDSFFTANLAAIDDPVCARNSVRAILSYQSPEGMVPNACHWNGGRINTPDRSEPPVGALCVWKMHQRYPDDLDFLKEVYPKLVRWHEWWAKYRDAKGDGLLEWGSSTKWFQGAQWETGWDDNLHYRGAMMSGTAMNCYAVDLCAMWAMDAHYLALLANALGRTDDVRKFQQDEAAMNRRINDKLWNDKLNTYCSRFWDDANAYVPIDFASNGGGFEGEYFTAESLKQSAGSRHDKEIDFIWDGNPPLAGMPSGQHWSARWKGVFTAPETSSYQFYASSAGSSQVIVDGKPLMSDLPFHNIREKGAELHLDKGQTIPIVVEYHQDTRAAELHLSVAQSKPAHGAFLTCLTPMNFYPLSAGTPDADRARRMLGVLTDPSKFWGHYLLPTVAYDDPGYHFQEYWRGDVWGPSNYIAWVGIEKYAAPGRIDEFADRNVGLFMGEWLQHGICAENYLSTTGVCGATRHYTWGALLNLVGLESVVDVDDSGEIVLNGTIGKTVTLKNIPLLGKVFDVDLTPGSAKLIQDGKVVLTAEGKIVRAALN
jgi:putative isomerase